MIDIPDAHKPTDPSIEKCSEKVGGWVELICVTTMVLFLIRGVAHVQSQFAWFLPWMILIGASVIPTFVRRERWDSIGLTADKAALSLRLTGMVSSIVFPVVFLGFLLSRRLNVHMPLTSASPTGSWEIWILYQFFYVSVSEEIFFRGYLINGVMRILGANQDRWHGKQLAAVLVSSAIFGIGHVAVTGEILSALTFFPGIIMGWLFIRTQSLLGPVLFHGLANCVYGALSCIFY